MHQRANSQSSTDSDFSTFQQESDRLAEQILQCNGQEAYEDYLQRSEELRAHQSKQKRQDALAKLARKARVTAIARRLLSVEAMIEREVGALITGKAAQRQLRG